MALRGKLQIRKWQTRNRIRGSKTILHGCQAMNWNKEQELQRF